MRIRRGVGLAMNLFLLWLRRRDYRFRFGNYPLFNKLIYCHINYHSSSSIEKNNLGGTFTIKISS